MLSSLPPELLHQIIESTVPHPYHTTTYRNRQRTLCLLSLVSKHFQTIAEPLLYEIVWIESPRNLKRFKRTIGSWGERERKEGKLWRPQTILLGREGWTGSNQLSRETSSEGVALLCSSVKSLTWDTGYLTLERLPSLNEFSNLTSLHLSMVSHAPAEVLNLPTLQSLTLYGVGSLLMNALLDPTVVPSLKHFSLIDTSAQSARHFKQSPILDLIPQLGTLNLKFPVWTKPELSFLHSAAERTLVDVDCMDLKNSRIGTAQIVNVRFTDSFLWGRLGQIELVEEDLRWVSVIETTPELSLRSLYLDSSLRPRSSLPSSTADIMDELLHACRQHSIEVVIESIPADFRFDPWISTEFVKRQKIRQYEERSDKVGCEGRS